VIDTIIVLNIFGQENHSIEFQNGVWDCSSTVIYVTYLRCRQKRRIHQHTEGGWWSRRSFCSCKAKWLRDDIITARLMAEFKWNAMNS